MKKAIYFLGIITILVIILFALVEVNGGVPQYFVKDKTLGEIKIGEVITLKVKIDPNAKEITYSDFNAQYYTSVSPWATELFLKYDFSSYKVLKPVTNAEFILILKEYTELEEYAKLLKIAKDDPIFQRNLTRAEFCVEENKLNNLIYKKDFVLKDPGFHDIKGHRYEKNIISSLQRGAISGIDINLFNPNGIVTREQLLKLLDHLVNDNYNSPDTKLRNVLKNVFNW